MTDSIATKTLYFLTGSQHLYGEETLRQVADDSRQVVEALNGIAGLPVRIEWKPVLTTPDEVYRQLRVVETDDDCVGVICWMHTFSPAKMWIRGLGVLHKPLCHLHTQFLRDIPYANIDMDYMNLHQSAHGGREFGHICTRLGVRRKVIVGHWAGAPVQGQLADWSRVALARQSDMNMKVARFGDNMRQVAVTEGDKVAAQITLGYSVNGYGMGELVERIDGASDRAVDGLIEEYHGLYTIADNLQSGGDRYDHLRYAARTEIGLRGFLEDGGFTAFTDTFENLTGMQQLPGLAVQRLMAAGYGFGGEGDWKTAALVRTMKVMATGLEGGNSFMEDYTYHFEPGNEAVLGSHMLEICPSIAADKPRIECHPLGIGGKADPCRLVFTAGAGEALNASLIDLGDRFRLLINPVTAVAPAADLPKLPVARVLWRVHPNMADGVADWIRAGGAHHTCFSQNLNVQQLVDYAEASGVESLVIG